MKRICIYSTARSGSSAVLSVFTDHYSKHRNIAPYTEILHDTVQKRPVYISDTVSLICGQTMSLSDRIEFFIQHSDFFPSD